MGEDPEYRIALLDRVRFVLRGGNINSMKLVLRSARNLIFGCADQLVLALVGSARLADEVRNGSPRLERDRGTAGHQCSATCGCFRYKLYIYMR